MELSSYVGCSSVFCRLVVLLEIDGRLGSHIEHICDLFGLLVLDLNFSSFSREEFLRVCLFFLLVESLHKTENSASKGACAA